MSTINIWQRQMLIRLSWFGVSSTTIITYPTTSLSDTKRHLTALVVLQKPSLSKGITFTKGGSSKKVTFILNLSGTP